MISEFLRLIFILIRCVFTSNKPVIDFNAIFETPLATVIEMDSRSSTEHEEKYEKGCRRILRCATGEVQAFVSLI